jgi:hypothetical protein
MNAFMVAVCLELALFGFFLWFCVFKAVKLFRSASPETQEAVKRKAAEGALRGAQLLSGLLRK